MFPRITSLVDFGSRVEVLQPFTSDHSLLKAAIERTRADGSTALYNAVGIAHKQLETARPHTGDDVRREVIVVLSDVYTKIADELTSQYVLGYQSSNGRRDGGWRNLAVHVHRPNVQARTRPGYFAPAP